MTSNETGIIALVPEVWRGPWTTRHHVLSRLSARFPVVWLEPPIEWRRAWMPGPGGPAVDAVPPPPGLIVHRAGPTTPKFYRPAWLRRFLLAKRLREAVRALRRRGCRSVVLYVWRPEFAEAREVLDTDFCVYHIDDEYSFADGEPGANPTEVALARAADLVLIHSPGLMETKGHWNPNTIFAPNGVDYALHATAAPEPLDLRGVPRPRIGYTGILKRTLDWELLFTIASRRPDLSLVLVGPVNPNHPEVNVALSRLQSLANVFALGPKRADEIAKYPQHFDVGIMPYSLRSHSARFGYPLKLHEYLASGIPTVGTSHLRTLRDFGNVILLADDAESWLTAIERALTTEERAASARARRQEVARSHDWSGIVERIGDVIQNRMLDPDRVASSRAHSSPTASRLSGG